METANPLLPAEVSHLRKILDGSLHLPGTPRYATLARPWNVAVPTSPAAVVEVATVRDVREAVLFAAANGLPVTVQATGHGVASDMDGALLIQTGALNNCEVYGGRGAGTARTGAGVTWKSALARCADTGLTGLCGSAPGVSVAGYTSGGGIGPMARTFGAASDRVRAIEVVTGDGRLRYASARHEAELFWGLRGGKGALGIVTALEFDLLPLPEIYAGALYFGAADVSRVLHAWASWCPTLPSEATTSVALMQLPAVAGIPEPLAGAFTLALRFVYAGGADDGAAWLAPMRSAGVPLIDAVGLMPSSMIGMVHSDPEDALPAVEDSALLTGFDAGTVDSLLEVAGPDAMSSQLMVEVRQFGGALAREPEHDSALCHRDAAFGIYMVAVGDPEWLAQAERHAEGVLARLTAWEHGGTLPNFSAGRGQPGFAASYTPAVLNRLTSLARQFDPDGLFRLGQVPAR